MKNKALFLDRDGVINRERGEHTWKLADTEVLPDVAEALYVAQNAGFKLIMITNQSGIGLGLYGHADVVLVHTYVQEELMKAGVTLADIYYCPHHPEAGRCLCRKPGSLMLEKAIAKYDIDPDESFMIGDKQRDVTAAEGAGVRGILVPANGPLLPVLKNKVLRG